MLAVIIFLAFWVVVGVGVVMIALMGGPRGARDRIQTQTRVGRALMNTFFAFMFVGVGLFVPALLLFGNHDNASKQVNGIRLTAAEKRGRTLFGEKCGVCHTLAAAATIGKVGPNLDTLQPPASLVLHTIQYGCLPNPPTGDPTTCLGQGVMPPQVVQGRDASDVAAFVGRLAGK